MSTLRDKTAIVGIGATEFSKRSGRSELTLAIEAISAALVDAGIDRKDVDGLVTFTSDNNSETEVFRSLGGPELKFFTRPHYGGGGGCGAVLHAAMAVAAGVSDVCVVYRAMNERSQYRYGPPVGALRPTTDKVVLAYHTTHGLTTPAAWIGMMMQRYMHDTGATSEDFATIAVNQRNYAASNPAAFFYQQPITHDQYMESRMIADPFRLLDCCQESDGAVAFVVVSAERAKSLRGKPVMIRAASQSNPRGQMNLTSYYRDNIAPFDEPALSATQLYAMSGLGPGDIQIAIVYDHFAPTVLPSLEAFGFCGRGEAKDFIKGGTIGIDGRLPVNTNGGQIGEAYIHGMNGIAEAVRQVRGTAVNQVRSVQNAVVTSGSAVPNSRLIRGAA